ncbi:MAG: hypothetical protein N4A50_15140 [Vallitalea sp.]|jgi:hypothetical protein|nr:hypothetical protein [Vallitalea sp.]
MHKYNNKSIWLVASYCSFILCFINIIFALWLEYPDIKINVIYLPIIIISFIIGLYCRKRGKY